MERNVIYNTARLLIGTPFLHQGRIAGKGIDCAGVPIWVAKQLGLGDFDVTNYGRRPDGTMIHKIEQFCQPISLQPGAILMLKASVEPQHLGICSDYMGGLGIVHAWDIVGKVVEHRLLPEWIDDKLVGVYGFPGVEYE